MEDEHHEQTEGKNSPKIQQIEPGNGSQAEEAIGSEKGTGKAGEKQGQGDIVREGRTEYQALEEAMNIPLIEDKENCQFIGLGDMAPKMMITPCHLRNLLTVKWLHD